MQLAFNLAWRCIFQARDRLSYAISNFGEKVLELYSDCIETLISRFGQILGSDTTITLQAQRGQNVRTRADGHCWRAPQRLALYSRRRRASGEEESADDTASQTTVTCFTPTSRCQGEILRCNGQGTKWPLLAGVETMSHDA